MGGKGSKADTAPTDDSDAAASADAASKQRESRPASEAASGPGRGDAAANEPRDAADLSFGSEEESERDEADRGGASLDGSAVTTPAEDLSNHVLETYGHLTLLENYWVSLSDWEETVVLKIVQHTTRAYFRQALLKRHDATDELFQALTLCEELGSPARALCYYEYARLLIWSGEYEEEQLAARQLAQEANSLLEDARFLLRSYLACEADLPASPLLPVSSPAKFSANGGDDNEESDGAAANAGPVEPAKRSLPKSWIPVKLSATETVRRERSRASFGCASEHAGGPGEDQPNRELSALASSRGHAADKAAASGSGRIDVEAAADDGEGGGDEAAGGPRKAPQALEKEESTFAVRARHASLVAPPGDVPSGGAGAKKKRRRPSRMSCAGGTVGTRRISVGFLQMQKRRSQSKPPPRKTEPEAFVPVCADALREANYAGGSGAGDEEAKAELHDFLHTQLKLVVDLLADFYYEEMKKQPKGVGLYVHFQGLATAARLQAIAYYKSREPDVTQSKDIAEQYKQLGDLYSAAFLLEEAQEAYSDASRFENGVLVRGVSFLWKGKIDAARDDLALQNATIKIQAMYRAWKDRKYIEVMKKDKEAGVGLTPFEVAMRRRVLPVCPSCGVCVFL